MNNLFQLPVEARIEVTKKAVETVKHLSEKSRKKPSENDMGDAKDPAVAYEKTLNHLQQSLAHLKTLTCSFITYLKNSQQVMVTNLILVLSVAITISDTYQATVIFFVFYSFIFVYLVFDNSLLPVFSVL